jgi:hypothetical protein
MDDAGRFVHNRSADRRSLATGQSENPKGAAGFILAGRTRSKSLKSYPNGTSGTEAGAGKLVCVDSSSASAEGERNHKRGAALRTRYPDAE